MGAVLSVGKHDGFVVVNKTDASADEIVTKNLVLQSGRNGEAEVYLLKVLLGDTQGFAFGEGVFPKAAVKRVDGVLEIFTFRKVQKRNGGLQENGKLGTVAGRSFFGGHRRCGKNRHKEDVCKFSHLFVSAYCLLPTAY